MAASRRRRRTVLSLTATEVSKMPRHCSTTSVRRSPADTLPTIDH